MPRNPRKTRSDMPTTIEEAITQVKTGQVSRRRFFKALVAIGATTSAIALLETVIRQQQTGTSVTPTQTEQQNLQSHDQHIRRQANNVNKSSDSGHSTPPELLLPILADYHPEAVVSDALTGHHIKGHAAIGERKTAEMLSLSGVAIEITKRYAYGDQVLAEWVVKGTHNGAFMQYPATGNAIRIQGLTVVTRENGLISHETLYYDAEEVRRQLSPVTYQAENGAIAL